MKKLLCLFTLLLLCCFLAACDPGSYDVDRPALDQVVSVELIEYRNPMQGRFVTWVPDHFYTLRPFDFDKVTVLETLPKEKIPEFLDFFSRTDILADYCWYDSPKDICLRLNYANGDFLIIWANYAGNSFAGYIGEYSSDGSVLSFWGSFSSLRYYTDLVSHFFTHALS